MIEVKKENGKILVKSYYDSNFIAEVKQIGGKWEKPYWCVKQENEDLLEDKILKILGFKKNDSIIKIEYNADDFTEDNRVIIGKKTTVERSRRRMPVNLNDTIVVAGGFNGWSGSAKNPSLGTDENTILRTTVSRSFLNTLSEDEKNKIKIIADINKDNLLKEKEALLKRLEEINKLLGSKK